MGFNLKYWNPICGVYFLEGSILEKYGKTASRRLRPDLGNNTRAATAGLGSIGLEWQKGKRKFIKEILLRTLNYKIGLYGKL